MTGDLLTALFIAILILVLGLFCEYASPNSIKSFVLCAVILNITMVLAIIFYLTFR